MRYSTNEYAHHVRFRGVPIGETHAKGTGRSIRTGQSTYIVRCSMSSIKPRCRSMFAMHSLECAPGRRPATTLWKEDVQRQRRSERRRTPPTSSRDPPPPKKPDRSRTRQMSRWTVVSEACSPNSSCAQRFGTKNTLDETQP